MDKRIGAPDRLVRGAEALSRGLSGRARLPLLHEEGADGRLAERRGRGTGGDLEDVALAGGELPEKRRRAKVELHLLARLHVVEGDEQHLVAACPDPEAGAPYLLWHLEA